MRTDEGSAFRQIGVEEHTREQQEILATLKAVSMTMRSNGPSDAKVRVIRAALENIAASLEGHFVLEETLMRRSAYSGFAMHKSEHDFLRRELSRLRKRMSREARMPTPDILHALNGWLQHHICNLDEPVVPRLLSDDRIAREFPWLQARPGVEERKNMLAASGMRQKD
jgi:hemerythrin-like metal-binding protein